jgi:glycosyltransferase involved in cell wall biosynthesis
LKVLVLTGWLSGGGAERVVVQLLNGPGLAGARVELGLLRREGAYIRDVDPALIHTRSCGERLFPSDGTNASFYMPHRIAMSALTGPLVFRQIIREVRPDVIMSVGRGPNLLVYLALKMMGADRPAWIVRDGNNLGRMTSDEARGRTRRRLGLALTRKAYRSADCLLVNSEALARNMAEVLEIDRRSVNVIRNPIDIASIRRWASEQPAAGFEGPFIFTAGRLVHQKGHDVLIRAFAASAFRRSHRLVIAGEGPELEALRALAGESGVGERVIFPGFQKNPWAWMRRSDLYVLPSRWEGCPNALAEALACGAPAVASDCQFGPSELITHERDGWLVRPEDGGALAEAMDRLLANGELRARLGVAAARTMEQFDRTRILPEYGALFAETARKRRVPVRDEAEDYGFAERAVTLGPAE